MGKLTAKQVETAIAKEKEYKLSDGLGLYLRVRTTGAKSWLYCFRLPGNRRMIPFTIGSLEDVPIKEARVKLKRLRKMVLEGIDPRTTKRLAIPTDAIEPGVWRYFKSDKLYKVLGVVKHTETLEDMVVYEALYDNAISKWWARPLSAWTEIIEIKGQKVPRFVSA